MASEHVLWALPRTSLLTSISGHVPERSGGGSKVVRGRLGSWVGDLEKIIFMPDFRSCLSLNSTCGQRDNQLGIVFRKEISLYYHSSITEDRVSRRSGRRVIVEGTGVGE